MQEDLHKISVHAKSHNIMYEIVNLEDTTNVTLSGVITHNAKPSLTNIPYYGLQVKERKNRKTKTPSPCQRNRMLCAINLCQDVRINHLSTDSGYDNNSCINFPFNRALN